ncbi:hypothetical protein MHYP_G00198390 [Metynnis hypsauchen]
MGNRGQGLQLSSTPSLAVDSDYNAQAVIAQRVQSSLTTSQQPRMTLTPFVDLVMLFKDSGAGFWSHLRPWEQTGYSCISVPNKKGTPRLPYHTWPQGNPCSHLEAFDSQNIQRKFLAPLKIYFDSRCKIQEGGGGKVNKKKNGIGNKPDCSRLYTGLLDKGKLGSRAQAWEPVTLWCGPGVAVWRAAGKVRLNVLPGCCPLGHSDRGTLGGGRVSSCCGGQAPSTTSHRTISPCAQQAG